MENNTKTGRRPLPIGRDDLADEELIFALQMLEEFAHRARVYISSAPDGVWGTRKREKQISGSIFHLALSVRKTVIKRREESARRFNDSPEGRLMNEILNNFDNKERDHN